MKSLLAIIVAMFAHVFAFAGDMKPISSGSLGCLALTAWNESRGQLDKETTLVLHVIKNRTTHRDYNATYCGVVLSKGQFQMGNHVRKALLKMQSGKPVKFKFKNILEYRAYEKINAMAALVMNGHAKDPTNGATHFYSPKLRVKMGLTAHPAWARKIPLVKVVSGFRFHRLV